ncbi:MAG: bifunctional heptose 7-phosphate kinase/heptose 1-phosphate adenyltransferase [Kiritimatiellia bacterium]|nr:PfkB family carbohydrate kinase [Lentisphaerota bacterium]
MKNRIQWASRLMRRFARRRILVVGDLMLDRYIYGSVNRISPEAPVPVVRVDRERNVPGGAANVARNVQTLGGRAVLGGVLGRDDAGRRLLEVLREADVDTRGVLQTGAWRTTLKTRVLAERQQVVRIDWEDRFALDERSLRRFHRLATSLVAEVDGVILEDYSKGAVDQALVDALLRAARQRGVPIALDPKDNAELRVEGITVATPNRREAFLMARLPERAPEPQPLEDRPLLRVAEILMEQWQPLFLVITLGGQGLLLLDRHRAPRHIPTVAREVFDVSGAGDTVIATLLLALAAGAEHLEAAELANCAAGVVVGKVGTAGCTARELLDFLEILRQTGMDQVRQA